MIFIFIYMDFVQRHIVFLSIITTNQTSPSSSSHHTLFPPFLQTMQQKFHEGHSNSWTSEIVRLIGACRDVMYRGYTWLITTGSGLDDWIYWHFYYIYSLITIDYNSSQSVTDLVLIYKSVTSSASIVRWLTLHSWTLNSLTNKSPLMTDASSMNGWMNELTNEFPFVTWGEPKTENYL
jgi:hypothetical protein